MKFSTKLAATAVPGLLALPLLAAPAVADGHEAELMATLGELNDSGGSGTAWAKVDGTSVWLSIEVQGLLDGAPHAQHIHYGEQARNECPTVGKDDSNGDFRLTTVEGVPAYGPVAVSLTKRGDTSPDSVLAVDRYPTAPRGHVHYERTTRTTKQVARAIRRGDAVVVIHGVDYNGNGEYDFESAGASELDSNLPAEATDPAVCGVLRMN